MCVVETIYYALYCNNSIILYTKRRGGREIISISKIYKRKRCREENFKSISIIYVT
jgi:hypothetical protein